MREYVRSWQKHAWSNGVEQDGLRIHAALVDMQGQLNIRRWKETVSASMGLVWFADWCHLTRNKSPINA